MLMEEWTSLRNDDRKLGFAFDLDLPLERCHFDSSRERLRGLFDEVLLVFLREKCASKCIRPIPALCGDGRAIDLFKLFWVVRRIGGYESVSRDFLWGFVAEECGFGFGVIPTVKLIYMKYLHELDQWLTQVFSKTKALDDRQSGTLEKLETLSRELETRFRGLLVTDGDEKLSENNKNYLNGIKPCINDDFAASADRVLEKAVNRANGFCEVQIDIDCNKRTSDEDRDNIMASVKKVIEKVNNKVDSCGKMVRDDHDDHDERFLAPEKDVLESSKKFVEKVISRAHDHSEKNANEVENVLGSRKRKRKLQSFTGMLKWLSHVAKHSDDPSVGSTPELSKWKEYGTEEFWVQAMLVRESLIIRRHGYTSAEHLPKDHQQKKPKMHPSMYDDDVLDHQFAGKLRCRKSISAPASTKSRLCLCCDSRAAHQTKYNIHQEAELENNTIPDVGKPPTKSNSHEVPSEKQVSVGPLFQAKVPEWTGARSNSDPKWLGVTMWAPLDGERISTIRLGIQDQCDCMFRGSVECVRFHIAENRLKLKLELGSLFHKWKFNQMGEEISLSWSEEEEKRFRDMYRSDGAFSNKFWGNASKFFPSKTKAEMVSYYFNVFLVRRRSYQNRVTPKDVDSDDEEKECGSIGDCFGYRALYLADSRPMCCTLNTESTELV